MKKISLEFDVNDDKSFDYENLEKALCKIISHTLLIVKREDFHKMIDKQLNLFMYPEKDKIK